MWATINIMKSAIWKGSFPAMVTKELKKLSRRELIELIYQMKKNEQRLQEEIAALQAALQEKRIRLEEAGSIADAAVALTGLLTAAQETANLYLSEISCMKAETQQACEQMLAEARQVSARIKSENPPVSAV